MTKPAPTPKPPSVPLSKRPGWRHYQGRWHYFQGHTSLCTAIRTRLLNRGVKTPPSPTLTKLMLAKHPVCTDCHAVKRQPTAVPVPPARGKVATGPTPASTAVAAPPALTEGLAMEFVKLLHAGLPGDRALAYIDPRAYATADPRTRTAWLTTWAADPRVLDAARTLNHGDWHHLDPDARLRIALDKHYAELGYFLYTHDWSAAEGLDLKKATDAREALATKLEGRDEADDTPMMMFLRAVQSGEVRFDKPAQLAGVLDKPKPVPVPLDPSVKAKGES